VTVIDEYQGRGVGGRLMDALLALARKRGVQRIIADVLRENSGMRALVNRYRAVVQRSDDPIVVRYRIDV
jgi:acetyltransferase